MAASGSNPSIKRSSGAYATGDIELRFGKNQQPLRANSQVLCLVSPTVLAPLIKAEPKPLFLLVQDDDREAWQMALQLLFQLFVAAVPIGQTRLTCLSLDALFPAMPILHKYNFSKLLRYTESLVLTDADWLKGTKQTQYNWAHWMQLSDQLQMAGLRENLLNVFDSLSLDPLVLDVLFQACQLDSEDRAKKEVTLPVSGLVLAEFDRLGVRQLMDKVMAELGSTSTTGHHWYRGSTRKCPVLFTGDSGELSCGVPLCKGCGFCPHCRQKS
eukprot:gene22141-29204_t